jgi:hypothetical protein
MRFMEESATPGFRRRPWWLLAVALVAVGQAGLARHLFGPAGLTDPRPVVSGRHPLHLYHAALGAGTFRDCYRTTCYDPNFQAGYPKTPVFDGGCRPAELALFLAGGNYDPAAYKLGLFALCVLAPLAFVLAGRAAGLSAAGASLAGAGGCLLWWSPPVRELLDAGSADLLLAGLTALVFVGGLIRYAADPGPLSWAVCAGALAAGWYAQPVVWLGLVPVGAAYYLVVAPRHGPAWHLGLVGMAAAGLVPNLWWLSDWVRFWWLRQPSVDHLAPLPDWNTLLGTPNDHAAQWGLFGGVVLAVGVLGLIGMVRSGARVAAWALASATVTALIATRLGATWPTLQVVAADRAAPLVAALLLLPAAWLAARWSERTTFGTLVVWACVGVPALVGWVSPPLAEAVELNLSPLPLGLSDEREELVAALKRHTTADARILIEEADTARPGWNWTALLPVLTDRAYLGGLDPGACVEHSFCGLRAGRLNGRPFAEWTPRERADFARRYNVGWVLCRSPEAADWWRHDPTAKEVGRFRDGGEVVLFALDRPKSFVLAGSATVERADRGKMVLTDVVPNEAGEVVLSLHYQRGLRATPTVVLVEGDKDLFDPIPMMKLRLPGPVSRVTLSWENP